MKHLALALALGLGLAGCGEATHTTTVQLTPTPTTASPGSPAHQNQGHKRAGAHQHTDKRASNTAEGGSDLSLRARSVAFEQDYEAVWHVSKDTADCVMAWTKANFSEAAERKGLKANPHHPVAGGVDCTHD